MSKWKLSVKYDAGQPRIPAGQSGGGRWASGGGTSGLSRAELESQGYIPVFHGTGAPIEKVEQLSASETGQLGPGVYFYDTAIEARSYVGSREGGLVTGFVHPDDVEIHEYEAGFAGSLGTRRVIVLKDPGKFVRRGNIPMPETDWETWRRSDRERMEARIDEALNEVGP